MFFFLTLGTEVRILTAVWISLILEFRYIASTVRILLAKWDALCEKAVKDAKPGPMKGYAVVSFFCLLASNKSSEHQLCLFNFRSSSWTGLMPWLLIPLETWPLAAPSGCVRFFSLGMSTPRPHSTNTFLFQWNEMPPSKVTSGRD